MDARKSAIFAFQLVKSTLKSITHLIQASVLGIQFWSVKYAAATVPYAELLSVSIPSHQAFSSTDASSN